MKVLQIIDNINIGGAERVMVNLCNWLHESGVDVEVVIIVGKEMDLIPQLSPSIVKHVLHRQKKNDIKALIRLSRLLKTATIAHVHMRHNYRYTRLASYLFAGKFAKIILHDHSSSESVLWGINTFLKPDFYIGTSKFSMDYARHRLNLNGNCYQLNNAVEKKASKSQGDRKGIVLVSNIKPAKNQSFAVDLMTQIEDDLTIYGAIQDKDYMLALQHSIGQIGLEERIEFNHFCYDLQPLLGAYKMGLHTSEKETGPLAIIEYLAQGLPFLAYKVGEAAETISEYFPEFFISNFDKSEWINRIHILLNQAPDLQKMEYVFKKHFSKESYIQQCLKIYQSILNS